MFLSVDIGNTNITFGLFGDDGNIETFRLESDKYILQEDYENKIKKMFQNYNIKYCVIGSVVEELTMIVKKACDNAFKLDSYVFNVDSHFDMNINLSNPKEVGADRIANAYAAKNKYPLPIIVVDIGTAITFDIVAKNGDFVGGVIMPGLGLQLKALNLNTSKLPQINLEDSVNAIGNSTKTAILSGIIRGTAMAVEGLVNQCEIELGEKATIVATGGCCEIVSKYMSRKFDYVSSTLTLEGFRLLSNFSKKI